MATVIVDHGSAAQADQDVYMGASCDVGADNVLTVWRGGAVVRRYVSGEWFSVREGDATPDRWAQDVLAAQQAEAAALAERERRESQPEEIL